MIASTTPDEAAVAQILGSLDPHVDVTIVVVNWNTRELLRACLGSLATATRSHSIEVIVVDNNSQDGSAAMVTNDFHSVRLIVNSRNAGFAAANNQGLRGAHGRYLLLLNSDTIMPPGSLDAMLHFMDATPGVGAIGPRLLNADGSLQSSARDFPTIPRDAFAILEAERWPVVGAALSRVARHDSAYWSSHTETRPVDWVMGACLMLRREALLQAGTLDDGYFFFAEEMDLCYRLRQRGWPVFFLADVEIQHIGGQSSARVPAARLTWHYKGLLRFYHKHRTAPEVGAIRAVIALSALAHLTSLVMRHSSHHELRQLLSAYARVLVGAATW